MVLIAPVSIVLIVVALSAASSVVLFTTWVRVTPQADVARLFHDVAGASTGFWLDELPSYFRMLYVPAPGLEELSVSPPKAKRPAEARQTGPSQLLEQFSFGCV